MSKRIEREHSEMACCLAKDGADIINDLTPNKAHLLHIASALMGEAGELFDAIKKHAIYNKNLDKENVLEELGDIEFYLAELRRPLGITRVSTLQHNIKKLSKRYEGKYSNEAAQARIDKEAKYNETDGAFIPDITNQP